MKIGRKSVMLRLSDLQYDRDEYGFKRGTYRARGETVDVFPAYSDFGIRIEMENNIIKDLIEFDPLTGNKVISWKER